MNMKGKLSGLALLAAMVPTLSGAQVIVNTSFEASQGFTAGQDLDLQDGWITLGGYGVINSLAATGTQSVFIDSSTVTQSYAWKLLASGPAFLNTGTLVTTVKVRYDDDTPADRSDNSAFGLEAFSDDGFSRYAAVMLDARGGVSVKGGLNQATEHFPEINAAPNVWHDLKLVININTREVEAFFNNQSLGGPFVNNTTPALTNVSDVDMTTYAFGTFAGNFGVTANGGFNGGFFDDYRAERVVRNTVSGNILLSDLAVSPAGRQVTIELINANTGLPVASYQPTLDASGNYTMSVLESGDFRLRVKGTHWLRKIGPVVTITNSGLTGQNFTLINGDVDGDNEVGGSDLSELSGAFLSGVGDPAYSDAVDLDGDGEVGGNDLSILSNNFLLGGD